MPFGGHLSTQNRWVQLAGLMPWERIEEIYAQNMSQEKGRTAIPARIAFGAIFIKESENLTDEGTVQPFRKTPICSTFWGCRSSEQRRCSTRP